MAAPTTEHTVITGEVPAESVKAFMDARNRGEQVKPAPDKAPDPEKAPEPAKEPEPARLPRSQRRQLNAAIREAAEERGRRLAIEEIMAAGKLNGHAATTAIAEDAEPQRESFPAGDMGTAAYLRATQKWDRAQEAKEKARDSESGSQAEAEKAHLRAMDEKAAADIATLPDWDAVAKRALEDEDAPELDPQEHQTLMGLLATSDVRAFALYHFALHPDELEKMLELSKSPGAQIRAFARLEGRIEKLYSKSQAEPEKAKPAAQADPDKDKDRKHLAEAKPEKDKPGETAGDGKSPKPKPSSEVAARGGQPAPDEPAIGSPAWMLKRNQMQYGH